MRLASIRSIPPYPLALALTGIITLLVNAGEPLVVLPRPALMAMLLVGGLQALFTLLLRSAARGAVAAACLMLLVAGMWPLVVALLTMPAWWLMVTAVRRVRKQPPPRPDALRLGSRGLSVFSVALLAISVLWGAQSGAFSLYAPPERTGGSAPASFTLPNIYLVLLDGYPGLGSLRAMGIDNEPFASALASRGFTVIHGSRSNYTQTWPTLASMFAMRYLDDQPGLLPAPADLGEQRRSLERVMNRGRALAELRSLGYRITTVPSAFTSAALLSADNVLDIGQMNEFEELLLRKSGLVGLLGERGQMWVASEARARVEVGIEALSAGTASTPTFFFDHILAPHPPFLFEADGSAAPLRDCYPGRCPFWVTSLAGVEMDLAEYREALQAELAYLNARLVGALDSLIQRDPTSVVILFSDHGTRVDPADVPEHFAVFAAARTPGKDDVFEPQLSLVNMFPQLFNAYLGTHLASAPYEAWASGELPLDLVRVTEVRQ